MSSEQEAIALELQNKHMNLTTGLDEVSNPVFYQYPNPVSDVLFVETALDEEISFLILDLNGKTYKEGSLRQGKNKLDLSGLPAGIYILNVPGYARRLLKR